MGFYVNSPKMTKEEWLEQNGKLVSTEVKWGMFDSKVELPVVHIDNGPFTAAGIAYSKDELLQFLDPMDERPKTIFLVPVKKLLEVCPYLPVN